MFSWSALGPLVCKESGLKILYLIKQTMQRFVDIVEDVTSLSIDEMEEIKRRIIIERRSVEIVTSGEDSKKKES